MKSRILILTLLGALLSLGIAQAQDTETVKLPGRKTVYVKDGGRWFIDLQCGAVMLPLGEANNKADFMKRLAPMPNLAIGQWHNPYFGTRIHAYAWNVYGFQFQPGSTTDVDRFSNIYGAASLEFMFDLVNYFGHYTPKRVFHFIPFVGIGAGWMKQSNDMDGNKVGAIENDFGPQANAGLIFKFRLGKRVDLNLEAQAMTVRSNMIGGIPHHADLIALASGGLTFRLGKTDFEGVIPMDWDLVNDLNGQINRLRAENDELSKQLPCPECPELVAPVTTEVETKAVAENVVYFRIGSAKIDQNQLINIYNTAQFAKANNSKITVVGYADEDTGTANWNMKLSEKRANAVAKVLVEEYGIAESDITIDYKGSSVQPYETNEWNRVVIMTAE